MKAIGAAFNLGLQPRIRRKCGLLVAAIVLLAQPLRAGPADPHSVEFSKIAGMPGKNTWIELLDENALRASGIAYVAVLARRKGAPVWAVEHVRDHLTVTSEALQRSVIGHYRTRASYPTEFHLTDDQWKKDAAAGQAMICATSIQQCLLSK